MVEQISVWLRPDSSGKGRPAVHDREQITVAAIAIADVHGLDAVSMRKVGERIGGGAASLYRHIENREELLELMMDAVCGEYRLSAPSDDWLTNCVDLASQAKGIMVRHRWVPELLLVRPTLGPRSLELMEYFLDILAAVPAPSGTKLEAFAMLTALTALSALSPAPSMLEAQMSFLAHTMQNGHYPHLAAAFANAAPALPEAQRSERLLRTMLTGLLAIRD